MDAGLLMATLRITAFKGSVDSFAAALAESDIAYHQIERHGPQAAGITLEAVLTSGGWYVLAQVLVAWLGARESRRINIVTKYGTVIWLEGCSTDDVAMVLESTTHIAVIDAKPTGVAE
ncbi:MAG: hypothetical protein LJE58_09425 [Thiogranum sp.]|jgi:hypothetical protein|nr:hypothetical protein [Thiogranum sp.]